LIRNFTITRLPALSGSQFVLGQSIRIIGQWKNSAAFCHEIGKKNGTRVKTTPATTAEVACLSGYFKKAVLLAASTEALVRPTESSPPP
jgi:hypothetical protein